jgi:hypothetical protein
MARWRCTSSLISLSLCWAKASDIEVLNTTADSKAKSFETEISFMMSP